MIGIRITLDIWVSRLHDCRKVLSGWSYSLRLLLSLLKFRKQQLNLISGWTKTMLCGCKDLELTGFRMGIEIPGTFTLKLLLLFKII